MYKKAVASFWTVEEVDLSQDMRDWERLSGRVLWECFSAQDFSICMRDIAQLAHEGMLTLCK